MIDLKKKNVPLRKKAIEPVKASELSKVDNGKKDSQYKIDLRKKTK